jgi:Flp pilus assembly pilin Flp
LAFAVDVVNDQTIASLTILWTKGTNKMLASIMTWASLRDDRRAVTALEYAMIVGVVVAIIMVGFGNLATDIANKFHSIGDNL